MVLYCTVLYSNTSYLILLSMPLIVSCFIKGFYFANLLFGIVLYDTELYSILNGTALYNSLIVSCFIKEFDNFLP